MSGTDALIRQLYDAFNRRDVDGCLALMTEGVDWPKASEGGRVVGKDEIRAYWTRQWAEFDPHVEPLDITSLDDGRVDVRVQQQVKDMDGRVLSDQVVVHTYTMQGGLIGRMEITADRPAFRR